MRRNGERLHRRRLALGHKSRKRDERMTLAMPKDVVVHPQDASHINNLRGSYTMRREVKRGRTVAVDGAVPSFTPTPKIDGVQTRVHTYTPVKKVKPPPTLFWSWLPLALTTAPASLCATSGLSSTPACPSLVPSEKTAFPKLASSTPAAGPAAPPPQFHTATTPRVVQGGLALHTTAPTGRPRPRRPQW